MGAELVRLHAVELVRRERERATDLERLKEAAERANDARARFLAAVSHDLRQPLHALVLFAESLARGDCANTEARELTEQIRASAHALGGMFDQLLDVSRLDAGSIEVSASRFALGPLLERLAAELRATAEEKGLELRVVPTRLVVKTDPVLVARILQNLIGNAVRHSRTGRVLVGCRRRRGRICVEVHDTGPGIPRERRADIFEEFAQLEGADRERGLGLGLSIVRRLAALLAQPVELRSEPGRGSVFSLELQRVSSDATLDRAQMQEGAVRRSGGLVVLVEDDPAVQAATRRLLEGFGLEVVSGASGLATLAMLEGHPRRPDAIVADYGLGAGETGLDVIAAIRSRVGSAVPALVVTGDDDPERLRAVRERGFSLLRKPIAPARLRAWLQRALRWAPSPS
jgi:CheY-like chemotaxis protein/two-component sensor histidine kinase